MCYNTNMKFIDLTNQKFGRLTVLEYIGHKGKRNLWKCRCECGKITEVVTYHLTKNIVKSCGCLRTEKLIERSTSHNKRYSKIYNRWKGIKQRCLNPNQPSYINYGGRGITICDEWKNDFMSFYNWSMQNGYAEKLTIDRINNDGNYEPSNCRWVDRKTQNNNTRANHLLTYNGKTLNISQWANLYNLSYSCLKTRIRNGWSIEKALLTPVKK